MLGKYALFPPKAVLFGIFRRYTAGIQVFRPRNTRRIMKIWKILSPKVLTTEERPDNITSPTQAKVKITQVLLTDTDFRIFGGTGKPRYPVVPGRFAVGIVTETGAECVNVEKNTRVFLHDVLPCRNCPECLAGKTENCTAPKTAGTTCEGYLREFVVADESDLSPLPPSVSDKDALLIGVISLCEAVIDRLGEPKGTHVAIFGADAIGNILSQLLIYHKAVPVLIDTDEKKLETASQCGIYYTLKADESLKENLLRITGGRLAAASVYCSFSGLPAELAFKATAEGGTVVCAGFEFPEMSAQLKTAFDKGLTVTAVTDEESGSAAAINLLVNKAVCTQPLGLMQFPSAEAGKLFAAQSETAEKSGRAHYGIIDML